jgi:hypothetical protein
LVFGSMTVLRGFAITIASGAAFSILGGAFGYALGALAPDYYRFVFRIPPGVDLEPAHAGLGLGLTQGLAAGLVVGLVIVLAVAWYNSRLTTRCS